MDPKGAQTEPKNQQTEPQGPTKYENHAKMLTKAGKVEPQVLQWSPRAPQRTRKAQKRLPKCKQGTKMCRKVPKNIQKHIDTTNQPRKQRETRISKQPNKPINTHIHIYTTLTARPLESSFELQTQTQTPAAGCSPKAT